MVPDHDGLCLRVARTSGPWLDSVVRIDGLGASERVIAFDPERQFAFSVAESSAPIATAMVESITLEPTHAGTAVTYCQALDPTWVARPLAPVLRRRMRRGIERGLAGLDAWLRASDGSAAGA